MFSQLSNLNKFKWYFNVVKGGEPLLILWLLNCSPLWHCSTACMCLLVRLWSQSPFKRLSWYDRLQGDSGGTLDFPWSGAAVSGMLRDTRALVTGRPVILEPIALCYSDNISKGYFHFLGKPDKNNNNNKKKERWWCLESGVIFCRWFCKLLKHVHRRSENSLW